MKLLEIRTLLEECENSILFAIFERARWKSNNMAYQVNSITGKSLFSMMLEGTEILHARLGRYHCPEEHPFSNIKNKLRSIHKQHYKINSYLIESHQSINHNSTILKQYFKEILPKITSPGEDENLGSAVTADINLLQALSRRIHLGKLVAQSKYSVTPEQFRDKTDADLLDNLTNKEAEDKILDRLRHKLAILKNVDSTHSTLSNIAINTIISIYREFMIPATKEVQISYFKLLTN